MRANGRAAWLILIARILVCVACGLLLVGKAQPDNCRGKAGRCVSSEGARSVFPVKIYRDFLVVAEGRIGGAPGSQTFILDTGTAPSIVNERLAKTLGLATSASTMAVVGKTVETKMATLAQLELGSIHVADLRVQVQDLSRVERDFGATLAGIIGLDVLARSSFRIDYERKQIEFGEVSDDGIAVAVDPHRGLAVARVMLKNKPVRMLVDTGTDQVVLLGRNFSGSEGFALRQTPQEGSSLREPTVPLEVLLEPELVVGGKSFTVNRAYCVPGVSDAGFDGLLGVRAMDFRAVAYDRERGTMYLQK